MAAWERSQRSQRDPVTTFDGSFPLLIVLGPCVQVLASLSLADCVGCIHMSTHLS